MGQIFYVSKGSLCVKNWHVLNSDDNHTKKDNIIKGDNQKKGGKKKYTATLGTLTLIIPRYFQNNSSNIFMDFANSVLHGLRYVYKGLKSKRWGPKLSNSSWDFFPKFWNFF